MTAKRRPRRFAAALAALAVAASLAPVCAAQQTGANPAKLSGHVKLHSVESKAHAPAIVAWLAPAGKTPSLPAPPPGQFTLVQKNRTFTPHLLIIPVGSTVSFPNQDPFFHNVFSLFNGRRFDLGLYEAGSSRQIEFSRVGVSYIFCNIHPEMSAVVIALATPLYAVADSTGSFSIHPVPPGTYELHVWIEGAPQPDLDRLKRRIILADGQSSTIVIDAKAAFHLVRNHLNMYGKPYPPESSQPY